MSEGDNRSERPFVLVGQVSPLELPDESGLPIATRVKETNATLIVLSEEAQMQGSIIDQVDPLHTQGVRVRSLTRFYDFWLGKLPVSELTRMHLFFDISDVHRSVYQRIKRAIDALVGLVGTFTFFLVAPLVAFVNLFGNRGPLLFSQVRVGQAGKAITIYKFRSMKPTATSVGEWTSENDPRITRIGRYLRLTHFDEIPQFLNILKGDISLVGPRPEQPHYVDELASKIPHYELRHSIRPGLTGWAQVKYPYGSTDADAIEKLEYELHYLAHQNPRTDASIVWRTARSILTNPSR